MSEQEKVAGPAEYKSKKGESAIKETGGRKGAGTNVTHTMKKREKKAHDPLETKGGKTRLLPSTGKKR